MDKSEIIILSSDDESETRRLEKLLPKVTVKRVTVKSDKNLKTSISDNKRSQADTGRRKSKNVRLSALSSTKQCQSVSKENPEIVDLEECLDKVPNDQVKGDCGRNGAAEHVQSHLKLEIINIDTAEDDSDKTSLNKINNDVVVEQPKKLQESQVVELNNKTVTSEVEVVDGKPKGTPEVPVKENSNVRAVETKKNSNKILSFFTEFVEFCGSLETIANDRIRLMKKLMKRYEEADFRYIESPEFRDLIQRSRDKVNMHNLYLVAKDVSAELSFRKQIKDVPTEQENEQSNNESNGKAVDVQEKGGRKLKKRAKFLRKIFNKLEEMGNKIRELEAEEVDLSDEEESSYVRLQRYRERYCMIYKKLCKYTNEIPDIDHLYNPKICFAESKYPTINKCIEVWLNKVKRFPDFTDIMKLLESQSASLGLPPNRESLRTIAVEIFQQVGTMLQRRRKYDLWDSFCGFLGDQIDPAVNDPVLEKVLKDNFEIRMKKEQEIFQHYTDLQEREKLEPEEVPEEEANCSPVESGNEDEKEIEEIENNILKRLDSDIEEGAGKEGDGKAQSDSAEEAEHVPGSSKRKESKNNYKNCKSMKRGSENSGKSKSEGDNSEDSDSRRERTTEDKKADISGSNDDPRRAEENDKNDKNDSDPELLTEEKRQGANSEKKVGGEAEATSGNRTPQKRTTDSEKKFPGKKTCVNYWESEENDVCRKPSNDSFDVKYCHVFTDNVFERFSEEKQDGRKRRVFRDMTNVNRMMKLHGKIMNASGWFTPSFFQPVFRETEKLSWKRRFKVSFRTVGSGDEKCALSQEEGAEKKMKFGAGSESNEKDIENNPGRGGDGRDGFCSGRGGESHEDGDEDRNRKNGKTGNDRTESKPEEEEDEEDDKDEGETETRTEVTECSQSNDKTEETQATHDKTDWPLEVLPSDKQINSPNLSKRHMDDRDPGKTQENILEVKEDTVKSHELKQETSKSAQSEFIHEKGNSRGAEKYSQQNYKNGKRPTEKESSPRAQNSETEAKTDDLIILEKFSTVAEQRCQPKRRCLPAEAKRPYQNTNEKRTPDRTVTPREPTPVQFLRGKVHRRKPLSASDEERVKRFLMHSPSSISITPPRKLTLSKPPSEAALQALATLRNLKGISATIVRGRPKDEDDVMVIGSSCKKPPKRSSSSSSRSDLPASTSSYPTPRIVTVVGNVSGFENYSQEAANSESNSSPIKISNVWGNLPNSFIQSMQDDESVKPGCSRGNSQHGNAVRRKSAKKEVEYVVLE